MQYASENIIPVTLELGGKSPNIFFADVMAEDDEFLDKALEGFAMFALNQGEVCTCPSRVLVQKKIYDRFMEKAVARVAAIKQGNPLDPTTDDRRPGQQRPAREDPVLHRHRSARKAPKCLIGGARPSFAGELASGYYVQPTVFAGHNKMRIFQEEIFGPVFSVTTFEDEAEALAIANDTLYGLGAGVWTRDGNRAYRMGRAIQAGPRVDQLLPPLSGPRRVRRLQAVGHRPREPQDDARPLPADQEPAGQLQPQGAGLLLIASNASPCAAISARVPAAGPAPASSRRSTTMPLRVTATPAALALIERLRAGHGDAPVPPVRRLLRRQRADVLSRRASSASAHRTCAWARSAAARSIMGAAQFDVLGAHAADHRRRARPRRGLLARGAGGRALPHPQPPVQRHRVGQT